MFLCDKYSPKCLLDMDFNVNILEHLFEMSKDGSIPHLILYGPSGSGKQTISRLLLEKIFDRSVNNITDTIYTIAGCGSTQTDISIKESPHHIIIEPNNNNFDKYLIQTVVKTYANTIPFFNNVYNTKKNFKIVLIKNIDNLSFYAQMSLRRTMEKYSSTCRFLILCDAISKVIEPLKSRCVCVKICSPSNQDIIKTLLKISLNENINISLYDLNKIITRSNNNIKHAIWLLECVKRNLSPSNTYIETIDKIIELILKKDFKNCMDIRKLLYNILITNISGSTIIQDIMVSLCKKKNISMKTKIKIIDVASYFEHNLSMGRREIIHLDGYVMNIISILLLQNDT